MDTSSSDGTLDDELANIRNPKFSTSETDSLPGNHTPEFLLYLFQVVTSFRYTQISEVIDIFSRLLLVEVI